MHRLHKVYDDFDAYIYTYITAVHALQDTLYRQDKANDVLYTHIYSFFNEKTYTATTFSHYLTLFQEDIRYLHTLDPNASIDQFSHITKIKQLFGREKLYISIQRILDIYTLGLWRILVR